MSDAAANPPAQADYLILIDRELTDLWLLLFAAGHVVQAIEVDPAYGDAKAVHADGLVHATRMLLDSARGTLDRVCASVQQQMVAAAREPSAPAG